MAHRSTTDNFFLSKGVGRLPCPEAKWLYHFLIGKAGYYGVFYEKSERLRDEFCFTQEQWSRAYAGLIQPCVGAAPRLYHQPEENLFFVLEQFDEQVIKKGFLNKNYLNGLSLTHRNLPSGIIKKILLERYTQFLSSQNGSDPAQTIAEKMNPNAR